MVLEDAMRPESMFMRVVFPAPLDPIMARTCPKINIFSVGRVTVTNSAIAIDGVDRCVRSGTNT